LTIFVALFVRDATEALPASGAAPGPRLFGVADRAECHRLGTAPSPVPGRVWPLEPGLVVEAAPAAEVEERVLARLEAVVADAVALVLSNVR
jgi:hypothetical protein